MQVSMFHVNKFKSRQFIYQLVSFVMVGFSLYGLAHIYTLVSHDPIIKFTKKCKYCRKRVNEKVKSHLL